MIEKLRRLMRRRAGREGRCDRGVEPPAHVRAYRDIGPHAHPDAAQHDLVELFDCISRLFRSFRVVELIVVTEKKRAVLPKSVSPRLERCNSVERRPRRAAAPQSQSLV